MFENNEQTQHNQYFWTRQIPQLNRKIQYVLEQIQKPLNYILPLDFDQKIERCRSSQEKWTKAKLQEYSDVIAFFIEGTTNISLIVLGQNFSKQFGGKSFFWIEVITDFAVCQKYDQNLKMWHINNSLKNTLHIPAQQYQKVRKFQKMAKAHIAVIKYFIKSIEQYQKLIKSKKDLNTQKQQIQKGQKNTPQKLLKEIQQAQSRYLDHDKKFTGFIKDQYKQIKDLNFLSEKMNFKPLFPNQTNSNSLTNDYLNFKNNSNNNSRSKNKMKSKNQQPIQQQKFITQFIEDSSIRGNKHNKQKQNFLNKIKGCHVLPPIQKNVLNSENINKLSQLFTNIANPSEDMNVLREQYFKKSRLRIQKPKKPHFVNINCEFSYFFYQNFFVNDDEIFNHQKINFAQPLKQYNTIAYEIDSEIEYDQLLGDDIQIMQSDDYSSVQSLSDIDFIDNEELQDFKCQVIFKSNFDNQRFIFNQNQHVVEIVGKKSEQQGAFQNPNGSTPKEKKERLDSLKFEEQFSIICLQTKLPIISSGQAQRQQFFQVMSKIVHGQNWKQILQNFQSYNNSNALFEESDEFNKQKYTRKQLQDFMKDHTYKKAIRIQGKKINFFYVKDMTNENQQGNKQLTLTNEKQENLQFGQQKSKNTSFVKNNFSKNNNNLQVTADEDTKFEDFSSINNSNTYQKTKRLSQNSSVSRHSNYSMSMAKSKQNQNFKSQKNSQKLKNNQQKQKQKGQEQYYSREFSKSLKNMTSNNNPDSQQTRRSRRLQHMQKIDYSKFQKIKEFDI